MQKIVKFHVYLFNSSIVQRVERHFCSPLQLFISSRISSFSTAVIRRRVLNARSKSPKPSNSCQSIPPSEFLSAEFTSAWRIILWYDYHDPCSEVCHLGNVLTMGVSSWTSELVIIGGSPSFAKPFAKSSRPTWFVLKNDIARQLPRITFTGSLTKVMKQKNRLTTGAGEGWLDCGLGLQYS